VLCNRRTTLAMAIMFCVPCIVAADDILGTYNCEGVSGKGMKYSGIKVVVTKRGESFEVVWHANKSFKGVGILNGDTFAAHFYDAPEGNGVILLKRQGNQWVGSWVRVAGKGFLHQETWTKVN
jgi:hypothetical protein